MHVWDEAKRESNLRKHGLDFADAYQVYESPEKCTYESGREGETRLIDIAMAVVHGRVLTLVYTEREDDVRIISFRPSRREGRKRYEEDSK